MKKTLKMVVIFGVILFVGVFGALAGYMLITKNKTFYIYDLRIVNPIEDAGTYVYVNELNNYVSMKNQKVYLTSEEENLIPMAVFAYTSTQTKDVKIESSNPNVAKIVYKDSLCFINYLQAGTAVITSSLGGVTDSITVEVYDQVTEFFTVYDYKYYGNYADYFPNQIIGYSDSITYKYDYVVFSAAGESAGDLLNNEHLRIDDSRLNMNVFEEVYIDPVSKQLVVTCKSDLTSNVNEQIIVQSYTYTNDGVVKVENNYVVDVNVLTYTPEFLQVELSTNPDFTNNCIFMDTTYVDDSLLTDEVIQNNPEILDTYLSYKKAENNLTLLNETSVYKTLFTDKVSKIYLRFRKVYTNGDIVYLNPLETANHYQLNVDDTHLKLAPTQDFYILTLNSDYFNSNLSFDIVVSLIVDGSEFSYNLKHTFKFEFANLNLSNVDLFYRYDEQTGVYTYNYWDPRCHFDTEISDAEGNIVGFFE